jgi:superfamily II RNA helicase
LRELIEIMMKKKLIKALFSTETFCIGVNAPAKTCIFTNLMKYTGSTKRYINTSEYRQMAGRAGRRGFDTFGNVIYVPIKDFPFEEEFKSIILGKNMNIKSNFHINYQSIFRFIKMNNLNEIFKKSLMNSENLDIVRELQKEKGKIETEIVELEKKIQITSELDTTDLENIERLIKLDDLYKNTKATKTKKQETEYKKIKDSITNKNLLSMANINNYENYFIAVYDNYLQVLIGLGYLTETLDLTLSGSICSLVSDCDVLLMTHIIEQKYLLNLTVPEIISLISIFSDPVNKNTDYYYDEFEGTPELHNCLHDLMSFIDKISKLEKKYFPSEYHSEYYNNFTVCIDYIDISYEWGSKKSLHEMLIYFKEYEENYNQQITIEMFCKTMLKIKNIIQIAINIYSFLNKDIEIIPKLEEAKNVIYRDVICSTSIYLTE